MKHLYVTLKKGNESEQSYVLEGDRRQTNTRMIQRALEKITDETVRPLEKEGEENGDTDESESSLRYKSGESETTYQISEMKLLEKDETSEYKRDNFTLIVNENVTENACRVRYSGTPGKR